jgi:hypothetical protein
LDVSFHVAYAIALLIKGHVSVNSNGGSHDNVTSVA